MTDYAVKTLLSDVTNVSLRTIYKLCNVQKCNVSRSNLQYLSLYNLTAHLLNGNLYVPSYSLHPKRRLESLKCFRYGNGCNSSNNL